MSLGEILSLRPVSPWKATFYNASGAGSFLQTPHGTSAFGQILSLMGT